MTNKKKRLVPQLRFKGFTNDWEQRKLENVLTESMISGTNGSIAKKLTVKLWGKGITPKSEVYRGSSSTKYYVRHSGQLMYGKLDFLHQAFGIVPARLDGFESTIDSPAFDISDSVNSNFLLNSILQRHFYLKEGMLANGSRKAKRINQDTFLAMKVWFPSLHEQNKIAKILQELDDTIALHQRKHGLLLKLKQGYLQRLFPENGSKIPELRLQGFTNDWEQRKLGDVVTRLKSYPLSRDVETTENSGYRYIHYGDIHTRVADVIDDESVLPQINPGKYEPIETGDLCLADASEDYQDIAAPSVLLAEHKDNVVAGLHTIALRPDDADPLFLYFLFKAPDFRHYVYREGQGLKVFGISAWSVLDYTCAFPSMTEQAEIVKLLRSFDTAIALHQKQLDQLKKLKQAYLQKLFV